MNQPPGAVEIRSRSHRPGLPQSQVRRVARALLRKAGFKKQGLSLVLVGDRRMRELNRRFLNHDWATDVLAFDFGGMGSMAGEIIISYETARRKARELGHSFRYEFYFYLCHGILHLAGRQDGTPRKRAAMFKKQERMLKELAIKP